MKKIAVALSATWRAYQEWRDAQRDHSALRGANCHVRKDLGIDGR